MTIDRDLHGIGVTDRGITLFEAQFPVPEGVSYNSYLLTDEQTAVIDTVDERFTDMWLENLENGLQGRRPDYLVITHMEPDHSAGIARFAANYPNAVIVASHKAFAMMRAFYGDAFEERRRVIVEGDTLSLGRHELCFYAAPMVHWPEVMTAYDRYSGTLFSADAFGRFGPPDNDRAWENEAARYYFGIVGKFGSQVTALLQKLAALPLRRICPLHGPVLTDNIPEALRLYRMWAAYQPDQRGVVIAYASIYGHTKEAVRELSAMLSVKTVVHDLTSGDMTAAVADAFRHDTLVLACPTLNMDAFPAMRTFLRQLIARNFCARTVGLIENGAWAPMAATVMRRILEHCHDVTVLADAVTLHGTLSPLSYEKLRALAAEINERHAVDTPSPKEYNESAIF